MKMSKELKAQFLGYYIGCDIVNVRGTKILKSDHTTIWQCLSTDNDIRPLLKPLSAISDEDAIEVAKIMGVGDSDFYTDQFKRFRKDHFLDYVHVGKSYVEYFTTENKWIVERVWYISQLKILQVFDFLRSKSYAIEWRGISVEEQVAKCWIKLVE